MSISIKRKPGRPPGPISKKPKITKKNDKKIIKLASSKNDSESDSDSDDLEEMAKKIKKMKQNRTIDFFEDDRLNDVNKRYLDSFIEANQRDADGELDKVSYQINK